MDLRYKTLVEDLRISWEKVKFADGIENLLGAESLVKAMKSGISSSELEKLRIEVDAGVHAAAAVKMDSENFKKLNDAGHHSWDLHLRPYVLKEVPPPDFKQKQKILGWYRKAAKSQKEKEGPAYFGFKNRAEAAQ